MARSRHRLACVASAVFLAGAPRAFAAFGDITLVGHLAFPSATRITNVWGYYDYSTGTEYALVGDWNGGFYIVDVTDPSNPIEVRKVTTAPGFDLKPFGHYVYSCDGNATGKDSRITDISDPANPVVLPGGFGSCHTITISTRGNMYTEYPGVTIYDIVTSPGAPDSLYHMASFGHDSTWRHDRLYDFNWYVLNIWDVSNPAQPVRVGFGDDIEVIAYHSGDESRLHDYVYVCDEYAVTPTPDIVVYSLADLANPTRVGDIIDTTAKVHQLYVVGDLMFVAYYTSGFKVYDITNPAAPVLTDSYDTSAFAADDGGVAYSGAYNAYPFAPSGIVYVSDHPSGLYLFSVEGHTGTLLTGIRDRTPDRTATLAQNYPNPFNPSTTLGFELGSRTHAFLRIYDVRGTLVRTLVDEELPAGAHSAVWNGTDDRGGDVASGVYYYRLDAGSASATRRMVLLK